MTPGFDDEQVSKPVGKGVWWQQVESLDGDRWVQAMEHAHDAEIRGDWDSAQESYRLAIRESREMPALHYHSLIDLAFALRIMGKQSEAGTELERAVAVANSAAIAHEPHTGFHVVLAMDAMAQHLLRTGRADDAGVCADEMLKLCALERWLCRLKPRATLVLSACALDRRMPGDAGKLLKRARKELGDETPADSIAAGAHALDARFWAAMGELKAQQGLSEEALECMIRAVAHRRAVVSAPQVTGAAKLVLLAIALRDLAGSLSASGRQQDAAAARSESDSILAGLRLSHRHVFAERGVQ